MTPAPPPIALTLGEGDKVTGWVTIQGLSDVLTSLREVRAILGKIVARNFEIQ